MKTYNIVVTIRDGEVEIHSVDEADSLEFILDYAQDLQRLKYDSNGLFKIDVHTVKVDDHGEVCSTKVTSAW